MSLSTAFSRRPVSVLMVALAVFLAPGSVGASTKYVLTVEPHQSHPGDTLYLSGAGFPPNTPLTIVATCNAASGGAKNQITVGAGGPTTDEWGHIVGAPFRLPALPAGLQLTCQLFPSFAGQGGGTVVPAVQTVFPSGAPLAVSTDPEILYEPTHKHGKWVVRLASWPGARLHAEIRYFPSLEDRRVTRTLGWRGVMSVMPPKGAFNGKGFRAVWIIAQSTFAGRQSSMDVCWKLKHTGTPSGRCA